ncbi:MAG: flavin-containing monooxygenase [Solirubrobacterales bacterium]
MAGVGDNGAEETSGELPWALIGAGPSGLGAARTLARRGIPFVGFEAHSDVGGLWDIEGSRSTMYETAHLISSRTTTAYDEFPMREGTPDYPSHWQMREYFRDYADTFDLRHHFNFSNPVTRVEPDGDEWLVTAEGPGGRAETTRHAGVIIANGLFSTPSIPEFEGEFTGEFLHTSEYRRPELFRGKRVLVIGAGNSGCDIAVDAVGQARSVDMSLRSGYWFFPMYLLGRPSDTLNEGPALPPPVKQRIDSRVIRLITGDPARLGFPVPEGKIYETHPVMNTLVLYHAGHGDIRVRPDVGRFEGSEVVFADGSRAEYDIVMLATGYRLDYPFIDREHLSWNGTPGPDLYLNIFTPRHRNLFVLGMIEATGLGWQGRYDQSELVAEFIRAGREAPRLADQMWDRINGPSPDLFGGYNYLQLDRIPFYVNKDAYRREIRRHLAALDG